MAERTLEEIYSRVAAATVKLPRRGGQGVLVEGSWILTAAHCLEFDSDASLDIALGENSYHDIESAQGEKIKAFPRVIEPCSDIAVLAAPNREKFHEGYLAYKAFCASVEPIPLCRMKLPEFPAEFKIHILTDNKRWVSGKATAYQDYSPRMWVEAEEHIEEGTSGGPIINDAGELVGVISIIGGPRGGKETTGPCPIARWALPVWICRRMFRARRREHSNGKDA